MNKIGPNPSHTPADNRSQKQSVITSIGSERRTNSASQTASSEDTVALSAQAIDMSALENTIKQLPEVDTARVVELHGRISAGEYQINTESIASKMLDLEAILER